MSAMDNNNRIKKKVLMVVQSESITRVDVPNSSFTVAGSAPNEMESKTIICEGDYSDIFGVTKREMSKTRKRLCLVKISSNKGITIHRECIAHKKMGKKYIGLTWQSISMLDIEDTDDVYISKGNYLAFYWNHPIHATRISTRLGIIGIIVSIFMSIFSVVLT